VTGADRTDFCVGNIVAARTKPDLRSKLVQRIGERKSIFRPVLDEVQDKAQCGLLSDTRKLRDLVNRILNEFGRKVHDRNMLLQDSRIDPGLADRFPERSQKFKAARLYRALPLAVNKQSALFSLFRRMMADSYKRGNYVIKCIHIIIEDDQIHNAGSFNRLHDFHLFFLLVQWFHWPMILIQS
jgi:hypothetical protein